MPFLTNKEYECRVYIDAKINIVDSEYLVLTLLGSKVSREVLLKVCIC